MAPQLWKVASTGVTEGLSLPMFSILILIQGGFTAHGFFIRDRTVMWSNSGAVSMTVALVLCIIYFRYLSG